MHTSRLASTFSLAAVLLVALGCDGSKAPAGTTDGGGGNGGSDAPQGGAGGGAGGAGGGGGTGGGSGCLSGQILCGGVCVTPSVDPRNCGGCGKACAAGQVCLSSGCTGSCPAPLSACAGTCVDLANDSENCGACGNKCPAGEGCVTAGCKKGVVVGPPPAKCAGGGPDIIVDGPGGLMCSGKVAGKTFKYGLCTCEDVGVPVISQPFLIDGYDSTMGPYMPGMLGGSLGANGEVKMSADFDVWGDMRVSAGAGLLVGGNTNVKAQLQVGTALNLKERLNVGMDAYVGGAVTGNGKTVITGTLFTPSCASVPSNVAMTACVDSMVTVPPPCPCAPAELLPIASMVAFRKDPANNDNAAIGLLPSVFSSGTGPARLDLPCGYYYLDQISITQPTVIAVHGKTAIFVGGSIDLKHSLTFTVEPTGTLDVFVGKTVYTKGALRIGSPAYPSRSRFYVGGQCVAAGTTCSLDAECCSLTCMGGKCTTDMSARPPFAIRVDAGTFLHGLFYSPAGGFMVTDNLDMYGAVFSRYYHATGVTKIHYDRQTTRAGDECMPPTTPPPPTDGGVPDAPAGDGAPPGCTPHDDDGDGYLACDCFTPSASCAPTDPSPVCVADCCDAPGTPGCPSSVATLAAAAAINPGVVEKNCDGIDNNCGVESASGAVTSYSCSGGTSMCLTAPPPSCPTGVMPCGPSGIDPAACPPGTACRNGCCINWVP